MAMGSHEGDPGSLRARLSEARRKMMAGTPLTPTDRQALEAFAAEGGQATPLERMLGALFGIAVIAAAAIDGAFGEWRGDAVVVSVLLVLGVWVIRLRLRSGRGLDGRRGS